jgi:hypothetical protein
VCCNEVMGAGIHCQIVGVDTAFPNKEGMSNIKLYAIRGTITTNSTCPLFSVEQQTEHTVVVLFQLTLHLFATCCQIYYWPKK